jgi:protein involved in polysaccharide export with SLBB domain
MLVVDSQPTEVYYTGGLLRGGEYPLPRDKSLTVTEAVALAGGPIATRINQFGISRLPPTELNILRRNGQNGQVNIRVDLNRAYNDPSQRILVAPGDHLMLRYKPAEQVGNFGIDTFNTYGLRRVFQ